MIQESKPELAQAAADFTPIPYIGDVINRELHEAGYTTFQDLAEATNQQLLAVPYFTTTALAEIRAYLSESHPEVFTTHPGGST